MSITQVEQQQLLIGGEWGDAGSGETFERERPLHGRGRLDGRGGLARGRARGGRRGRGRLPRVVGHAARRRGASCFRRRRRCCTERAPEIAADRDRRDRRHLRLGDVQLLAGRRDADARPPRRPRRCTGEVIPSDVPGLTAMAVRQPAGVVVGIAPWNAPIILGTRAVATPLAFGNTVVLKASEICPRTHGEIARALADAGAAAGRGQPGHALGARTRPTSSTS